MLDHLELQADEQSVAHGRSSKAHLPMGGQKPPSARKEAPASARRLIQDMGSSHALSPPFGWGMLSSLKMRRKLYEGPAHESLVGIIAYGAIIELVGKCIIVHKDIRYL